MSQANLPTQILQLLSDAIVEVADKVAPSVVRVGSGRGIGSGVVWSEDGYIVTCSHIVGNMKTVEVGLKEGLSLEARVVGRDPYTDVALLKIEGMNFKPIEVGDSEGLKTGQFVLAFANPFGQRPSVISGIITGTRRTIRGWWGTTMENAIVTDARFNPGYSGGPLVDALGRMVGLNVASVWSRGIAIPVNTIKNIVDSLAKEGKVKRAYLGIVVNTVSLPKEIARQPQINQSEGLMILSVEENSPAKKAGLAMGDIVLRIEQKPITNVYDLHRFLSDELIGKPTKLLVIRAEEPKEITIVPTEAAD